MSAVLGISALYHDAAACLVVDGRIVAAAQEERFTRRKADDSFPTNAIRYCLAQGGVRQLDAVAFYDKPLLKLHRILETHLSIAPRGLRRFAKTIPVWLREKLWVGDTIPWQLERLGVEPGRVLFYEHHHSHAASAFYPSPFESAAVVTLDGVGEWATTTISAGNGASLRPLWELRYPHSLGLLYSAFTAFTGFRVNSGEYKLMGLAPYGQPRYAQRILDNLIDLKEDGSFRLDMDYFTWLDEDVMVGKRFARLFDGPARMPETSITRRELDIASSIQQVTEEVVLRITRHARALTDERRLCLSGGVALNCVANGRVLRESGFDELWVQPAAGDSGSAVGAALAAWHETLGHPREVESGRDRMRGALLGPEFSADDIERFLLSKDIPSERLDDESWALRIAELIDNGGVVGLVQGRMEFGPRALGNRSIVADPRSPQMQSVVNQKIKFRESFRPFAPAVLRERAADYFELDRESPYMLLTAPVRAERRLPQTGDEQSLDLYAWASRPRSQLPAVTHVDYSARVQTVDQETNPRFWSLLSAFEARTGCPVLLNTSFNVRGEPIVCTPEDAYRCFMATELDWLVLGPFLLDKRRQPAWSEGANWRAALPFD